MATGIETFPELTREQQLAAEDLAWTYRSVETPAHARLDGSVFVGGIQTVQASHLRSGETERWTPVLICEDGWVASAQQSAAVHALVCREGAEVLGHNALGRVVVAVGGRVCEVRITGQVC